MNPVSLVERAMIEYYAGDVRRINHFLKVYGFAKAIGELEGLDAEKQLTLEIAALTHDIGIRLSEQKYHNASGEHQQVEGPPEAQALLNPFALPASVVQRVLWLIAHHHSYSDIRDADHQMLVEADFLVNLQEDGFTAEATREVGRKIFRTATGLLFLQALYGSSPAGPG